MKKERLLSSSNDDEYSSSKKHSSPSDENDGDQSPPPPPPPPSKSRKISQGMCSTFCNETTTFTYFVAILTLQQQVNFRLIRRHFILLIVTIFFFWFGILGKNQNCFLFLLLGENYSLFSISWEWPSFHIHLSENFSEFFVFGRWKSIE